MKTLILFTLTLIPALAQAGALTDKAYQVAAQLGSLESSLSPQQRAQVNQQLDALLSSLTSPPAPSRGFSCVSRDNDNSRPYVLAYKDFTNVTRIRGAVYGSLDECQKSLAASLSVGDYTFACASRDDDGSRPYKIVGATRSPNAFMLQHSVFRTLEDCTAATLAMQQQPEGILYCGSRDNDGAAPFTQTGYKYDGSFVPGRDEYRTLNDCTAAL